MSLAISKRSLALLCVLAAAAAGAARAADDSAAPDGTPAPESATPSAAAPDPGLDPQAAQRAKAAAERRAANRKATAAQRAAAREALAGKGLAPDARQAKTTKAGKQAKQTKHAKAAPAKKLQAPPALPVARIVEKNVAARGGLAAWRALTGIRMSGELDAGGTQNARLPFVMVLKRPNRSRLEIEFQKRTAVQVWGGAQGWKVRPFLDRNEVEPYTDAEAKLAAATTDLDAPLVDLARKGTKVELAGTEVVEGRQTYKLALTRKDGERRHLWVDAKTFLDAKLEGEPRRMDGRVHQVAVFFRDFKRVGALQLPHTVETVVDRVPGSHRLSIRKIDLNPALADALFAKPQLGAGSLAAR
jgi:hypothetical protein